MQEGLEHTREQTRILREQNLIDLSNFDVFISSPAVRAQETLAAMLRASGLQSKVTVKIMPEVLERNWGTHFLQQQSSREREEAKRLPQALNWRPAGGETMAEVRSRAALAVNKLHREYPGKRVLVLSHNEFVVGAIAEILHVSRPDDFSRMLAMGMPNSAMFHLIADSPNCRSNSESQRFSSVRKLSTQSSPRGQWSGEWLGTDPLDLANFTI